MKLVRPKTLYINAQPTDQFQPHGVHLIGNEFDGTSCYRKGAFDGPNAFRKASLNLEDYSPYTSGDMANVNLFDMGNLPSRESWEENTEAFRQLSSGVNLEKNKIRIITLGGEHSISFAPIELYLNQYPDLYLIHLDAHADLRDGYEGYHYSHASIICRVRELFGPGHDLLQYGIRSGTKEEFMLMKEIESQATSRTEFLERVRNIPDDRPIYLTLDLDFFDPAYMPGTGTPEAGGEDFHCFISLVKLLKNKNFVGADVVELAPPIDPSGNSDCFASKVVRELMVILKH